MRLHHLWQRPERGAYQHELVIRRKARGRLRREIEQGDGTVAVARKPGAKECFGNGRRIVALRKGGADEKERGCEKRAEAHRPASAAFIFSTNASASASVPRLVTWR